MPKATGEDHDQRLSIPGLWVAPIFSAGLWIQSCAEAIKGAPGARGEKLAGGSGVYIITVNGRGTEDTGNGGAQGEQEYFISDGVACTV